MKNLQQNALKFCLLLFVLISIVSIYFTFIQVFIYGFPEENILGTKIGNTINKPVEELKNRNNKVTITIGDSEPQNFVNVKTIYLETRKPKVNKNVEIEITIISPEKLVPFKEFYTQEHIANDGTSELLDYSLHNLMLQTATGSGNAYARGGCCVGPTTNSDGSVTERKCSASLCD